MLIGNYIKKHSRDTFWTCLSQKPPLVLVGSLETYPSGRGTQEVRKGQQGILLKSMPVWLALQVQLRSAWALPCLKCLLTSLDQSFLVSKAGKSITSAAPLWWPNKQSSVQITDGWRCSDNDGELLTGKHRPRFWPGRLLASAAAALSSFWAFDSLHSLVQRGGVCSNQRKAASFSVNAPNFSVDPLPTHALPCRPSLLLTVHYVPDSGSP